MNILLSPFIYVFFLTSSTLMVISSSSFFSIWLGLELNILSFIPMMNFPSETKKAGEASIKYFLIQSIASSIILFSAIWFFLYNSSALMSFLNLMMTTALCTKLGLAPFHAWFPEVMEGLSWINSLILMTWQKISPMVTLSLFYNSTFILMLALTSALVGAISGLNQTSLRKILAFSSVSHMGWMLTMMSFNSSLWINYLLIYFFLSFISCISFWFFNLNFLSQLFFFKDSSVKTLVFLNLLSMGGMPPLLGFLAKMYGFLVISKSLPVLMVLIFSSLITLFFYTRICLSCFTLSQENSISTKVSFKKSNMVANSLLMILSVVGLVPICILVY
uniref:NADH-ubiquinone oxidoreductase chain 2 n=1 Tax=Lepas australis TaxID=479279 RepID=A0A089NF03_9CRUS|nr:NADH dehydrogenase subunit 2 [Lepas australis]AIQ85060.1 NADH dehydrogenase subunit 2 [Lepas australis]